MHPQPYALDYVNADIRENHQTALRNDQARTAKSGSDHKVHSPGRHFRTSLGQMLMSAGAKLCGPYLQTEIRATGLSQVSTNSG